MHEWRCQSNQWRQNDTTRRAIDICKPPKYATISYLNLYFILSSTFDWVVTSELLELMVMGEMAGSRWPRSTKSWKSVAACSLSECSSSHLDNFTINCFIEPSIISGAIFISMRVYNRLKFVWLKFQFQLKSVFPCNINRVQWWCGQMSNKNAHRMLTLVDCDWKIPLSVPTLLAACLWPMHTIFQTI